MGLSKKVFRITELQYNQMQPTVTELWKKQKLRKEINKFEMMLNSGLLRKKTLSKMYSFIMELGKIDDSVSSRWEVDINQEVEQNE